MPSDTILFPANPKFQKADHPEVEGYIAENMRLGRAFETEFLIACRKVGRYEKLPDKRLNKPPCDHYSVWVQPRILTFFECKSTGCRDLPLSDIKPHQLEAMNRYDHAFPGAYAGFVIQYRALNGSPVYYIAGKAVQEYLDQHPGVRYLPTDFMRDCGLPIGIREAHPNTRLCNRLEIRDFLARLSKT